MHSPPRRRPSRPAGLLSGTPPCEPLPLPEGRTGQTPRTPAADAAQGSARTPETASVALSASPATQPGTAAAPSVALAAGRTPDRPPAAANPASVDSGGCLPSTALRRSVITTSVPAPPFPSRRPTCWRIAAAPQPTRAGATIAPNLTSARRTPKPPPRPRSPSTRRTGPSPRNSDGQHAARTHTDPKRACGPPTQLTLRLRKGRPGDPRSPPYTVAITLWRASPYHRSLPCAIRTRPHPPTRNPARPITLVPPSSPNRGQRARGENGPATPG